MPLVCKRVHYRGDVQGVGFRYTAHGLAQKFAVAGFVKNLPDGQVELIAQGEPGEVNRFLDALARRMASCIVEQDVEDANPQEHNGFQIRY